MVAEVRRALRLWLNGVRARLDAFVRWYEQRTCPHSYRPARINNKPGRLCRICDRAEELTPEEYFALFGEKGWQG